MPATTLTCPNCGLPLSSIDTSTEDRRPQETGTLECFDCAQWFTTAQAIAVVVD